MNSKKLTRKQAEAILKKLVQDNIVTALLNACFPKQREIIEDPSRLKAVLASRRFGKSYLAALYLIIVALRAPHSKCVYLAKTRESAKDIMWEPKLLMILRQFNIPFDYNLTTLIIKFPNGSTIKLQGADGNEREPAKLRGNAFSLIVLDECQDFTTDLRKTVYSVLKATTIDNLGTIVMFGTPGDLIETENPPLFYSVTTGQEHKFPWKLFKANTVDNPFMKVNFQSEIAEQLKFNPDWVNSNDYKREYLGEWVINHDRIIYRFNAIRNVTPELPEAFKYTYVMGLDFGFNDHTAFVIGAYSKNDPILYIIKAFKKTKMTLDDVQEKLVEYMAQYRLNRIICDHSAQMVETLRNRLHYNFIAAEKINKFENIDVMNDDLQAGKIKLLPGTDDLKKEWNSLVFDHKSDRPKELDSCENHCFIAGTKITTSIGLVNIEDINQSHLILTRDGFKPVLIACETGIQKTYKITTVNGLELSGTANHPIFANGEFTPISELKTGDILITNLEFVLSVPENIQLTDIQFKNVVHDHVQGIIEAKTEKVYNLSVSGKPEYFANGILVHNCSDATLYMFRDSRHFMAKPMQAKFMQNTIDYYEQDELNKEKKRKIIEQMGISSAEIDFGE